MTHCKPTCDPSKAKQTGRATWMCPVCKRDISLHYLYWWSATPEGRKQEAEWQESLKDMSKFYKDRMKA